jgi:hypothetical protein
MDYNEEIVTAWLNIHKKMFTINNIMYGNFHSDVDILAISLASNEVWDCEIKIRTGTTKINNNNTTQNGFNHFINCFNHQERQNKIEELINKNNFNFTLKKVFITTKSFLGKTDHWINEFKNNKIEVLFFEDIIQDLNEISKKSKKASNLVIHTFKLINKFSK